MAPGINKRRREIAKMSFNEILHRERIKSGYSQNFIAKAVGLNRSTLNRYEKGIIAKPDIQTIFKIAEALKISPAILLEEEKEDEIELMMLHTFRKLDTKTKYLVIELTQKIVRKE